MQTAFLLIVSGVLIVVAFLVGLFAERKPLSLAPGQSFLGEAAALDSGRTDPPDTTPDLEADPARLIEETKVVGLAGFPPKVTIEILTADGQLFRAWTSPQRAHRLSDDLLRNCAHAVRKDRERDREAG